MKWLRAELIDAEFGGTHPKLSALSVPSGQLKVETDGAGFFQPIDDGQLMTIIGLEKSGTLLDLLAFNPDEPSRWWRRTGWVNVLGDVALTAACHEILGEKTPAFVHADLSGWIDSGGEGCVILDWQHAAMDLIGADLVVETVELGNRLDGLLRRPPESYRIRVARPGGLHHAA